MSSPSPSSRPPFQTISVFGAATMCHGSAHFAARSVFNVILNAIVRGLVDKGLRSIDADMQRAVDKGRLTADEKTAALARIRVSETLDALKEAGLVVAAEVEEELVK